MATSHLSLLGVPSRSSAEGGTATNIELPALQMCCAMVVEPAITVGTEIALPPLLARGTIQEPNVTLGTGITPSPLLARATIVDPAVTVGTLIQPPPLVVSAVIPAATVTWGTEISLPSLVGRATLVEPFVDVTADINIHPLVVHATIVPPAFEVTTDIALPTLLAVASLQEPSTASGTSIDLGTDLLVMVHLEPPSVSVGNEITLSPLIASATIVSPGATATAGTNILLPAPSETAVEGPDEIIDPDRLTQLNPFGIGGMPYGELAKTSQSGGLSVIGRILEPTLEVGNNVTLPVLRARVRIRGPLAEVFRPFEHDPPLRKFKGTRRRRQRKGRRFLVDA